MNKKLIEIKLGASKEDRIAAVLKSIAGAVPIYGSALSEIIGTIIPNQRLDRIEKYLTLLSVKISEINADLFRKAMHDPEFIDLIEESCNHASRAISDDRQSYISEIVKNGFNDNDILYSESKYILKLIQELSDQEIVLLRSYFKTDPKADSEFRQKHEALLTRIYGSYLDDNKRRLKASLQLSYKEHLERLGLIKSKLVIDRKTKKLELDQANNLLKTTEPRITHLGKVVLNQIGFKHEPAMRNIPGLS